MTLSMTIAMSDLRTAPPRYLGRAWDDYTRSSSLYLPIPVNHIYRVLRSLWATVRFPTRTRWEGELREAHEKGRVHGFKQGESHGMWRADALAKRTVGKPR